VHRVPPAGVDEAAQRDRAGLQFRDVQQPFAEIAEGVGHDDDRAVDDGGGDVVRHAHESAVLQKLVEFQIGAHLARQVADHELGHRAKAVVFRHRGNVQLVVEQRQGAGGRELEQPFDAVDIAEGKRRVAAIDDLRLQRQEETDRVFKRPRLRFPDERPAPFQRLGERGHAAFVAALHELGDFEEVEVLDFRANLRLQRHAVVLGSVEAHVPVARHPDLRRPEQGGGPDGLGVAEDRVEGQLTFAVGHDVLEMVAHVRHRLAQGRRPGLIGRRHVPAAILPAAQAPEHHRLVPERLDDGEHRPGRNPAGDADDQQVEFASGLQLAHCSRRLLAAGIVGDRRRHDQVDAPPRQRRGGLGAPPVDEFSRGVDLPEAHKACFDVSHVVVLVLMPVPRFSG